MGFLIWWCWVEMQKTCASGASLRGFTKMPGGHFCTNRRFARRAEAGTADVNSHRLHHVFENPFRDFVRLKKASAAYDLYTLVAFHRLPRAKRVLKKMIDLMSWGEPSGRANVNYVIPRCVVYFFRRAISGAKSRAISPMKIIPREMRSATNTR